MEKIKVTHAQYNEILKEQVGIYWNRRWSEIPSGLPPDEYWEKERPIRLDMDAELDRYSVIPVDVDHPNLKVQKLIQRLCSEVDEGNTYSGSVMDLSVFANADSLWLLLDKTGDWVMSDQSCAYNQFYVYEKHGEPTVECHYSEGDVIFRIIK